MNRQEILFIGCIVLLVFAGICLPASAAPTFSNILPTSGTTAGGTSVTITGTGFTGATSVTFGGTAATSFTVVSNTSITATTPAGTAGAAEHCYYNTRWHRYRDIHVYSFGTVIYQRLTDIRYNSRWHLVTITGTGFTGATAVTFGTTPELRSRLTAPLQLLQQHRPARQEQASIVITTPGGTATGHTRIQLRHRHLPAFHQHPAQRPVAPQ